MSGERTPLPYGQRAVPVLMYHSIGGAGRLAVRPEAFAEQMAWLKDGGFTPLPFGARTRRALRPVVITFDDGYADFHTHALPVLESLGFAATVFVTTGWLDDAGPYAAGSPPGRMLTWAQTEEITSTGVEVGAHGHSHRQLDQLGGPALREELHRSRELLQERLGRPVRSMAYPYGYSSARVRREVRACGYTSACAVANAVMTERHDPYAVPRVTVRAGTSLEGFGRALEGRGFRTDHALTKGYAVVRRSRYAARRLRGVA
ncbi:polysaccharide deacetylase family protein [Actinomadura sp. DC4]|uniref:polysaccharide deacetylase family protein n=1 Tax=Actinomadura sp. DC4 TaxID=3055069 RepID=UPI0025AF897F|nr:polysaccharide deacetylase family protein [Actinomadura sp. DC4]MDN3359204.1 polysaccharide deacetylase family protein [Actinomadura sp. DC4]